jgi:predicted transcriptional regulator
MDKEITGRDLFAERKRLDIRQDHFAKAAKLNQNVVSAIEKCSIVLPQDEMKRLWDILHDDSLLKAA